MPKLQRVGAIFAALFSIISIAAVLLGLAAATRGGSLKLDDDGLLLLLSFLLIAVLGFTLAKITRGSAL